MIRAGSLHIESAGDSPDENLTNIPNSNVVQQLINRLIDEDDLRRRSHGRGYGTRRPQARMPAKAPGARVAAPSGRRRRRHDGDAAGRACLASGTGRSCAEERRREPRDLGGAGGLSGAGDDDDDLDDERDRRLPGLP